MKGTTLKMEGSNKIASESDSNNNPSQVKKFSYGRCYKHFKRRENSDSNNTGLAFLFVGLSMGSLLTYLMATNHSLSPEKKIGAFIIGGIYTSILFGMACYGAAMIGNNCLKARAVEKAETGTPLLGV